MVKVVSCRGFTRSITTSNAVKRWSWQPICWIQGSRSHVYDHAANLSELHLDSFLFDFTADMLYKKPNLTDNVFTSVCNRMQNTFHVTDAI